MSKLASQQLHKPCTVKSMYGCILVLHEYNCKHTLILFRSMHTVHSLAVTHPQVHTTHRYMYKVHLHTRALTPLLIHAHHAQLLGAVALRPFGCVCARECIFISVFISYLPEPPSLSAALKCCCGLRRRSVRLLLLLPDVAAQLLDLGVLCACA